VLAEAAAGEDVRRARRPRDLVSYVLALMKYSTISICCFAAIE